MSRSQYPISQTVSPPRPRHPAPPGHRLLPAFATFLTLATACTTHPHPAPWPKHPNIVILVVETLRADHLRPYGYPRNTMPNLEDLADEGVLFEHATTVAPWTLPSVVSILTGLPPSAHGVTTYEDRLSDKVDTLAERLRHAGYHTAFLGVNSLFESDRNLEQGFDHYFGIDEISSEELNRNILAWLHDRPLDRPVFLYVHYFDPHCRYAPPEDYNEIYWPVPRSLATGRTMTRQQFNNMHECFQLHHGPDEPILDVDYYLAQYDAELRHVDAMIGVFLERLKTAGLYDSSLIFAVGDHGEEFYDHGGFGHGRVLYEHTTRVPFIVKVPGGGPGGRRVRGHVSTLDIPRTVLGAVGLDAQAGPFGMDLRPILGGREVPRNRAVYTETDYEGTVRAVIQGRWKLIVSVDGKRPGGLFDLSIDPGEQHDRSSEDPRTRAALYRLIVARAAEESEYRRRYPSEQRPLSDRVLERLKALGYVE